MACILRKVALLSIFQISVLGAVFCSTWSEEEDLIPSLNGAILIAETDLERQQLLDKLRGWADEGYPEAMTAYARWNMGSEPYYEYIGLAALLGDFEALKGVWYDSSHKFDEIMPTVRRIITEAGLQEYFKGFESCEGDLGLESSSEIVRNWVRRFEPATEVFWLDAIRLEN